MTQSPTCGYRRQRARNEDWVEKAVRKSESIDAEQALRLKVIDFVAAIWAVARTGRRPRGLARGGKQVLRTKGPFSTSGRWGPV